MSIASFCSFTGTVTRPTASQQAIGAAIKYASRYGMMYLLNLRSDAAEDRDTDGRDPKEVQEAEAKITIGRNAAEGDIVELNEVSRAFVAAVSARLRRQPGLAWFADYGPARSAAGDSLQALANKQPIHPLTTAGTADLTAHVDFADLASVALDAGVLVQGPVTQGGFLTALGLFQRTERLARAAPDQAEALIQAARRLADPAEMGDLFKVLALRSPGVPALPGLA
jgi:SAM-dependent MidA family methyltransferase